MGKTIGIFNKSIKILGSFADQIGSIDVDLYSDYSGIIVTIEELDKKIWLSLDKKEAIELLNAVTELVDLIK